MPINNIIEGNLLTLAEEGKFRGIVHGCNCFCTMGKGIALEIRNNYPQAYWADRQTERGDVRKLGAITRAVCGNNPGVSFDLFNAYTQFDYKGRGPHVHYGSVRDSFNAINHYYESWVRRTHSFLRYPYAGLIPVGIPRIGAGLAGGDWDRISDLINMSTPRLDITLVNFTQ